MNRDRRNAASRRRSLLEPARLTPQEDEDAAATIGRVREARAQAGGGATRRNMLPGGTWKRQLRSKVR